MKLLSRTPRRSRKGATVADLFPTHCDECGALLAYMTSHPRGYMICPDCNEKRYAEQPAADQKGGE